MPNEAAKIIRKILSYSVRKPNGCLICYLGISGNRPKMMMDGKSYLVSRIMMHICKDFDLSSKLSILHNDDVCKSSACIELDHMRIGTHQENMMDNFRKNGNPFSIHSEFCKRGHPRVPKNIRRSGACKLCDKIYDANRKRIK